MAQRDSGINVSEVNREGYPTTPLIASMVQLNPADSENCQDCHNDLCPAESADDGIPETHQKRYYGDFFELPESFVQNPSEHLLTLKPDRRYHSVSQPGFDS